MISTLKFVFSSFFIVLTFSLLLRAKGRARGLRVVSGPPSPSWLTGHEMDIRCQLNAGENELKWTKHGLIVRLAGCFGQSNLGNRACIGWRFALMQLQVLTVLMVNKFSYEPDVEVKFAPTQIGIFPALEGKYEEGNKVPLKVKALAIE